MTNIINTIRIDETYRGPGGYYRIEVNLSPPEQLLHIPNFNQMVFTLRYYPERGIVNVEFDETFNCLGTDRQELQKSVRNNNRLIDQIKNLPHFRVKALFGGI